MSPGRKPPAPVDESERLARHAGLVPAPRRQEVADAGGALIGAAFSFLSALLPSDASSGNGRGEVHAARVAEAVKRQLQECVTDDEEGRPR